MFMEIYTHSPRNRKLWNLLLEDVFSAMLELRSPPSATDVPPEEGKRRCVMYREEARDCG